MDKNVSSRKIISFYHHWRIFFALFDEIFMFYFLKSMLLRILIWELLCKSWVTIADHYLLSVWYLYDSFFSRYVTPQMKNLLDDFRNFFLTFCDGNSTSHLLDLLVSEQWSPVLICGCYSSFAEWSLAVTRHLQSDCQMRNRCSMLF
jgi:hypothetical protein